MTKRQKLTAEIADRIEGQLDLISRLDDFLFHEKREAAEKAAALIIEHLQSTTAEEING